jgi:ArsR family transcriptional regulator
MFLLIIINKIIILYFYIWRINEINKISIILNKLNIHNNKIGRTIMSKGNSIDIIKEFVAITKALSDINRVRAIMALRKGELCVCQIIELLGLAPSTVSKHMLILKQAKLVDSRKDGRWVYYKLAKKQDNKIHVEKLVNLIVSMLENDEQIIADDTKLEKIMSIGIKIICEHQREGCKH